MTLVSCSHLELPKVYLESTITLFSYLRLRLKCSLALFQSYDFDFSFTSFSGQYAIL